MPDEATPPPPPDVTKLTVKLIPKSVYALDILARDLGVSKTDVVNQALQVMVMLRTNAPVFHRRPGDSGRLYELEIKTHNGKRIL